MFKSDLELRQAVFEKMGYEYIDMIGGNPYGWFYPKPTDGRYYGNRHAGFTELPPIETSWEVCAKYLVPWMRERGFGYEIMVYNDKLGHYFFWYGQVVNGEFQDRCRAEIQNDNLALAACEAFMEVEI